MKSWALPSRGSKPGEHGFDPLLTSLMRIQVIIFPYWLSKGFNMGVGKRTMWAMAASTRSH